MVDTDANLKHILREASRCADVLVCMGGEQKEAEVRMLISPNEIVKEMMCDMKGVPYGRGT